MAQLRHPPVKRPPALLRLPSRDQIPLLGRHSLTPSPSHCPCTPRSTGLGCRAKRSRAGVVWSNHASAVLRDGATEVEPIGPLLCPEVGEVVVDESSGHPLVKRAPPHCVWPHPSPHQPPTKAQIAFFKFLDLYWRSPESGDLWYKSMQTRPRT